MTKTTLKFTLKLAASIEELIESQYPDAYVELERTSKDNQLQYTITPPEGGCLILTFDIPNP